jgi:hypothetical protein
MASPSFLKLATVTASTKRATMSGALQGTPSANLVGIKCTPLDPVDAETLTRLKLESAYQLRQTFTDASLDIIKGDVLTVSSVDYPIKAVETWSWRASNYLRLVIELIGQ